MLICIGLVTGAEGLRPIHWRVWAGQAEKEGRGSGPYERLENRVAFVDIRVSISSPYFVHFIVTLGIFNLGFFANANTFWTFHVGKEKRLCGLDEKTRGIAAEFLIDMALYICRLLIDCYPAAMKP